LGILLAFSCGTSYNQMPIQQRSFLEMNYIKKHKINLLIALILMTTVCFTVFYVLTSRSKWDNYFRNTIYREPSSVVTEASKRFKMKGKAIDFGAGAGNEAVYLLREGWDVWAVDGDPLARDWILSRGDIPDRNKLVIISSDFEEINWDLLPQCQLIVAVYSLPFCHPESFSEVWEILISKLEHGGRFAGHFFGSKYRGFSEKEQKRMTFLKKEDLLALFRDFDFELFDEMEEDSKSATGAEVHSHIFNIIARKK